MLYCVLIHGRVNIACLRETGVIHFLSHFHQTTLELLHSEHPDDLKAVETHLNRIRSSCIEEVSDVGVMPFGESGTCHRLLPFRVSDV